MKMLIALTSLGFGILSIPQMLWAENLPPGSYQLSCNSITVNNNKLTADCETLSGSTQKSTLSDLSNCLMSINNNGDIGNIDGNLVCISDLPKIVSGFNFPEAETTLNQWIYNNNTEAIYQHAWGIWAGLTQTIATIDGQAVRAFETWNTLDNIKFQTGAAYAKQNKSRLNLSRPNQFRNAKTIKPITHPKKQKSNDGDTNIFVSVAYNPPAAKHTISNKLLLQSTLNTYLEQGYTQIPDFPNNAITIKPVYKLVPKNSPKGIYTFPGWPGTPNPAKTYPEQDWNACVYININEKTPKAGGNSIDKGCKNRNDNNTFYLSNFIHQQITAQDANYLSTQLSIPVSTGDYAILVGIHVTTRETKRWAWQSFWWSVNPKDPYSPSSKAIAAKQPSEALDAAAQHYAMTVAYSMVNPAQPITGGQNIGHPVIAYNPHLEAGFDPATFQIIRPINGTLKNQYGVQTNCMTCHSLALYDPSVDYNNSDNREKPYAPDFYISLNDNVYTGKLQLDFAWSILGALELDAPKKKKPSQKGKPYNMENDYN